MAVVGDYLVIYSHVDSELHLRTLERIVRVVDRSSGSSRWGGGGGYRLTRDYCPEGDFSPSYYDGTCGVAKVDPELDNLEPEIDHQDKDPGTIVDENSSQIYLWAREHHLTSMETYEKFRPYDRMTRAELAKIVVAYRALIKESKGESALPFFHKEECQSFTDLRQVNTELQGYIVWACELGLMGYHSDGETLKKTFSPNTPVTRAEVATVISRMFR